MAVNAELLRVMGPELELLLPRLDERSARLVLGMAARAAGEGGTGAVAALTGASWQTVANGKAELESGEDLPPGRVRRPGGGRKRLAEAGPGLLPALEELMRDSSLPRTRQLLADTATVIEPAPITLATLDDLRDYAARHGIALTVPPHPAGTSPDTTLTTPTRRKLTLKKDASYLGRWATAPDLRPRNLSGIATDADRTGP